MLNRIWLVLLAGLALSCATFYQLNYEFNQNFEAGRIEAAGKLLDANKRMARNKVQFLYYVNQGVVNSMLGHYEESNNWLERAYIFGEDYQQNYANLAASYLINPNMIVYAGEDHEHLLLLYYKALNFLRMQAYESALVECRRLNIRLHELSDKYRSDNKYRQDAFVHNLMGIIYEASGDYNNAFIAYRNSYTIYKDDYSRMFGISAPDQLKQDLLRAAHLTGFDDQVRFYEREFDMEYKPQKSAGELVFFWHNGLGPVKAEWSINFTVVKGAGGAFSFVNEEYGFSFPYTVSEEEDESTLSDMQFFRVAFPRYVARPPLFTKAELTTGGGRYQLELAEDVNKIAFKTLEERMLQELGKGLLRAALKKAAEVQIRKENEDMGFVVGLINAVTEKADTRNWQTIPHSIYYTRVPMKAGQNIVTLRAMGDSRSGTAQKERFTFDVSRGETVFHVYQSLETKNR